MCGTRRKEEEKTEAALELQHAFGVGGLSVALRSRGYALCGNFALDLPLWKFLIKLSLPLSLTQFVTVTVPSLRHVDCEVHRPLQAKS